MKNYILPLLLGGVLGASIIYFVGQSDAPPEADTLKTMNTKIPQDIIKCLSDDFKDGELEDLGMLNWIQILAESKDVLSNDSIIDPLSAKEEWETCDKWVEYYQKDNSSPKLKRKFKKDEQYDANTENANSWHVSRTDVIRCLMSSSKPSGIRIHLAQLDYNHEYDNQTTKRTCQTLVLCGTEKAGSNHDNVRYKKGYAIEYLDPCPTMCNTDTQNELGK